MKILDVNPLSVPENFCRRIKQTDLHPVDYETQQHQNVLMSWIYALKLAPVGVVSDV